MTKPDTLRLWEVADEKMTTYIYVAAVDKLNASTLAKRFFGYKDKIKMAAGVSTESARKVQTSNGTLLDLMSSQQKHGIAAVIHRVTM